MAMNKYMHPRNIYKKPPDFRQMALECPEFREFVTQDVSGKVTFDFKNLKALRALSQTLLKKDFGLDIDIPLHKLIPTIPLRLNYILWIEDLLSVTSQGSITGVDVGTGASCVYPLIAAKKNGWKMIATEVDLESYKYASENVSRNNLNDLIKVVHIKETDLIKNIVADNQIDFVMCNPPFFSSKDELNSGKSRSIDRPKPKNAFCATITEVVHKGGEVEFITKLILESKDLKDQIKVFTTMIGHKSHLPALKKLLREAAVTSFNETEFCQGNTTRWGLAWTFQQFNLQKVSKPKLKSKPNIVYIIPDKTISLSDLNQRIMDLFKELKFVTEEVTRNKRVLRYFINAFSNTWSHQRRKRRAEKLNSSNESNSSMESNNGEESEAKTGVKREHEDDLMGSLIKKIKTTSVDCKEEVFFKFMFAIHDDEQEGLCLEMNCCEGFDNRDYLYQILQLIKNRFKF